MLKWNKMTVESDLARTITLVTLVFRLNSSKLLVRSKRSHYVRTRIKPSYDAEIQTSEMWIKQICGCTAAWLSGTPWGKWSEICASWANIFAAVWTGRRDDISRVAAAVKLTSAGVSAKGHCHRLSDMTVQQRPNERATDSQLHRLDLFLIWPIVTGKWL